MAGSAMTATFDTVTGQRAAARVLRTAVAADRLGHALLLVGPGEVGQRHLVAALAAALNCPTPVDGAGCGECSTCRRIGRDAHGAVVTFRPEGATHLVDAVRDEWIPTASRTLVEGTRRVCRVVEADRMNESTQNAFLKVLEEPPPSTVWVLEATSTAPLLDTILSRCQRIDLTAWGAEDLTVRGRALGLPDDVLPALVRAAQGSPARLAEYTQRECPTCGAIHSGTDDQVPTNCDNRSCPTNKKKDQVPAPLERDLARRRHLGVVRRLRTEGPAAVGTITSEVVGWADARAAAESVHQAAEIARLDDSFGARGWPTGMRGRITSRHKREQRQARLEAMTRFLDEFGSLMRDVVAVRAGMDTTEVVNLDAETLVDDAAALPTAAALEAMAAVPSIQEAIVVHSAQPQLQLERLLLPLAVAIFANRDAVVGSVATA